MSTDRLPADRGLPTSATGFRFEDLRRHPDVEAPNLFASDATDRLILDEAALALGRAPRGSVVVIGDRHGALTLGAAALHGAEAVRVHQDALSGERALQANAERAGLAGRFRHHPLDASLVLGARVVLLQLPRSLDALADIATVVAAHADRGVEVVAGGRVKHMTRAMNEVLGRRFAHVDARLARQKSRVLVAREPLPAATPQAAVPSGRVPVSEHHADLELVVCAVGGVFAGTRVDIGTRALLRHLDGMASGAETALDLGCGTGVLAVALARARPGLRVVAIDDSAAAVLSARATVAANGLTGRVDVVQDDGASHLASATMGLVVLNPPFHAGATVHPGAALKLFAEAARVLRPGGELWAVWNSHLAYRPALERLVGPTRQVARNAKFTVTVSARADRSDGDGRPGDG